MSSYTHIYCDVCGTQMDYQDVDGDSALHGIQLEVPQELRASVTARTSSGSSSSSAWLQGRDFCSFLCFHANLTKFQDDVEKQWPK